MYKSHLHKIQLFTHNARLHIRGILVKVQYLISCANVSRRFETICPPFKLCTSRVFTTIRPSLNFYLFIHSLTHSLTHSIHSFIHSFIHSLTHSLTHLSANLKRRKPTVSQSIKEDTSRACYRLIYPICRLETSNMSLASGTVRISTFPVLLS